MLSGLTAYLPETALTVFDNLEFFIRIVLAAVLGALVGLERSKRQKEAGVRTHCIIACTSALFMILSKYAFVDLVSVNGLRGADPARIAAQVVSGISFIGLAVIYRNGSTLKGLTTAAGIWATAGIGMAIGAGMYPIGIATTVIIILMQSIMHRFNIGNDALATRDINITMQDTPEMRDAFLAELKSMDVSVIGSHITHNNDGTVNYGLTVKFSREIQFEEILAFMDSHPGIKNIAM